MDAILATGRNKIKNISFIADDKISRITDRVSWRGFKQKYKLKDKGEVITTLKLAQASTIIEVAIAEGQRRSLSPLTVAVLDAGGHLIAF